MSESKTTIRETAERVLELGGERKLVYAQYGFWEHRPEMADAAPALARWVMAVLREREKLDASRRDWEIADDKTTWLEHMRSLDNAIRAADAAAEEAT